MNAVTEQRKVLLEIADLKVHFDIKDGKQWFWQPSKTLKAVDGVTLRLYEGETLGVVGNPAAANRLCPRDYWSGEGDRRQSRLAGKDLLGMKQEEWRDVRSDIQMIFQDPLASLNRAYDYRRNYCRAAAHLSSKNVASGSARSRESDDDESGAAAEPD
jgi:oligopeptide transport system ATP-binding protein